ncbi:hypothetical protein [Bdellovibrio sp. HCB2-146]
MGKADGLNLEMPLYSISGGHFLNLRIEYWILECGWSGEGA